MVRDMRFRSSERAATSGRGIASAGTGAAAGVAGGGLVFGDKAGVVAAFGWKRSSRDFAGLAEVWAPANATKQKTKTAAVIGARKLLKFASTLAAGRYRAMVLAIIADQSAIFGQNRPATRNAELRRDPDRPAWLPFPPSHADYGFGGRTRCPAATCRGLLRCGPREPTSGPP
jgi:hypothetical protein